MRKNTNSEKIEGRLYQHELVIKKVKDQTSANFGKDFISGTLDIATDEEGLNIITIHFTYVAPTTSAGKVNATYGILEKIIKGAPTWVSNGKDEAMKLKVNTSLSLNDFLSRENEMVAAKVNEGGFVSEIFKLSDEKERNSFIFDMLITNVRRIEADEEKGTKDKAILKGAIFNFKNDLLPVELAVTDPDGMDYFESLGISPSEPVYTKIWGNIVSLTVKEQKIEKSAFGAPGVRTVEKVTKDWVVTGTSTEAYAFGEEGIMTAEELRKAISDREVHLAEVKKRAEEYRANNNSNVTASNSNVAAVNPGSFKF